MKKFLNKILGRTPTTDAAIKKDAETARQTRSGDPLDIMVRQQGWKAAPPNPVQRTIAEFPVAQREGLVFVADSAETLSKVKTMDDNGAPCGTLSGPASNYTVPESLQQWYNSQSFIGYQACALIAQHWLVDKACSMAGEDAIRNGW